MPCCLDFADNKKQCFIASQNPPTRYLKAFITIGNNGHIWAEPRHALRILELISRFTWEYDGTDSAVHVSATFISRDHRGRGQRH
jgi:hypothetical protein